ncbi:MAG: TRAP transporter substrate-binding protein [Gracilibacteraceae bacterium]|jgi:tripartite ATP-independent transporter DctP family solute receptor|nr:TRAP transporter substrate-binding protein [Gracilibacteraceae bacterium]
MPSKKLLAVLLSLCLAAVLATGCGQSPAEQPAATGPGPASTPAEKVVLKIGYGGSPDMTAPSYVQIWADRVSEATEGRISFEIYPSGQLGTLVEMLEACELGTLDVTLNDPSLMETYLPEIALLSLPFIIKDYAHMDTVFNGEVGDTMIARLDEQSNLHVMGWVWNGFRSICAKKPLRTLADCENLVIRSPESDIYVNTFRLLGMSPTPVPLNETFTAMQTGVVEAVDSPIENFVKMSFYELGKNILISNHLASSLSLIFNQDKWDSFSAEDQKLMLDIYDEVFVQCNQDVIAAEQTYYDQLVDLGCAMTEFENRQEVVNRFTDYWTQFAQTNNCQDLLQQIIDSM